MSYLLLSGRLSHQNWPSLLWLASNFDLSCPSLCCSMVSGGLPTSIHSPYCSVDCQMPSPCCLCYPYGHQETKIYTHTNKIMSGQSLSLGTLQQARKRKCSAFTKSTPETGYLTPILTCLLQVNAAMPFYMHSTYYCFPFAHILRALHRTGLT